MKDVCCLIVDRINQSINRLGRNSNLEWVKNLNLTGSEGVWMK